ncbi:hypothetical protein [Azospirillum sp.]|uniref:hypothetical protein n=1 Tax=Azospirillum sp. TaxID=34012 RepID=UPI003D7547E6
MPTFLDLDNLPTGAAERVLKLNGREHTLKPMSVADFIENTRMIQAQGNTLELAQEFELMITLIQRGFPTIAKDELMGLTLPQLNRILDFTQPGEADESAGPRKNPRTRGK